MSLESPRDLRFEGANAPEHRRPRAPSGSKDFALFQKVPEPHMAPSPLPARARKAPEPHMAISSRYREGAIPRNPSVRIAKRLCR